MEPSALKRTPLEHRHLALGARMTAFAGWWMPVQYQGILAEHLATRTRAGLFDLCHMGQVLVTGADALPFLQWVTPNDVAALAPGQAHYSMLLYPHGGVVDDILVYRLPADLAFLDADHATTGDRYLVVVNAANTEQDVVWLQERRAERADLADVTVRDISASIGMLAVQGPRAVAILQRLTPADLASVPSFSAVATTVADVPVLAARTGYTGEDGFELYCPIEQVGVLWDAVLAAGEPDGLVPVGLGARDTLRLEACLPLYGNELSPEITPLEAGLGWVVKFNKGDFIGRSALLAQKERGIPRKLVGFRLVERGGVPRSHCPVVADGREIGMVTSGTTSPTLRQQIGLALIAREYAGVGRSFAVVIRGTPVAAEQVKTPFYKRSTA